MKPNKAKKNSFGHSLMTLLALLAIIAVLAIGCGGNKEGDASEDLSSGGKVGLTDQSDQTNSKKDPVSLLGRDVRLRQAIALAIDKGAIVENSAGGNSKSVDYLVPEGFHLDQEGNDFRGASPLGYLNLDRVKAQKLWQEATADLISKGFIKVSDDGKTGMVTLKLLTFDAQRSLAIAEQVKQQLEKSFLGLTIEVIALPYTDKLAKVQSGDFDLDFTGWRPDYRDAKSYLELWTTDNTANVYGYSSDDFDAFMDRASTAETGAAKESSKSRIQLLQEAEAQVLERDTAVVPIYQRANNYLVKPYVKGIQYNGFGTLYDFLEVDTSVLIEGIKQVRVMVVEDVTTLDAGKARGIQDITVLSNTMEGLVRIGANGGVKPAGATSWQVSEDGMTYTFKLRPEALWSSGSAVKAQDYAYAFSRNSAVQLEAKALDDFTLQVITKEQVPHFMQMIAQPAFFPKSQAFVEKMGDNYGTTIDSVLYNGPFTVTRWEMGYGTTLTANPRYWQKDKVALLQIQNRLITDDVVAKELYDGLQLEMMMLGGDLASEHKSHPEFVQALEATIYYFAFNLR